MPTAQQGINISPGLRTALRLAAWACIAALAILSLAPSIPRTQLGGHSEHVLAYAGTALITAVAYSERGAFWIGFALIGYAAALEFLQRFSPGRHSSVEDFAFSAAGILVGVVVSIVLGKLAQNFRLRH